MEINEFVDTTSRLEKYYDKEYTSEQRKIMYDMLKQLTINEYKRAINNCLNTCKILPKIADIKNGLAETNNQVVNKQQIDFVKCKKCSDGFIKYYKTEKIKGAQIPYDFLALCTCENGRKQREINGYSFPLITEIGLVS